MHGYHFECISISFSELNNSLSSKSQTTKFKFLNFLAFYKWTYLLYHYVSAYDMLKYELYTYNPDIVPPCWPWMSERNPVDCLILKSCHSPLNSLFNALQSLRSFVSFLMYSYVYVLS